jgi:hypothetical protein
MYTGTFKTTLSPHFRKQYNNSNINNHKEKKQKKRSRKKGTRTTFMNTTPQSNTDKENQSITGAIVPQSNLLSTFFPLPHIPLRHYDAGVSFFPPSSGVADYYDSTNAG